MSDIPLDRAILKVEGAIDSAITPARIYIDPVLDAARRVANLDIEAATPVIYELRYVKDSDDWDDQIEDITRRAVEIALGISEWERFKLEVPNE